MALLDVFFINKKPKKKLFKNFHIEYVVLRVWWCACVQEEMLIFMELCVEGSLEALVATAGALAEPTVRRYTKQLVSAVSELHARSIAHRDIKSESQTPPTTPPPQFPVALVPYRPTSQRPNYRSTTTPPQIQLKKNA